MNRKLLEELYEQRSDLRDRLNKLKAQTVFVKCESCGNGDEDVADMDAIHVDERLEATDKLINLMWSEANEKT